MPGAAVRPVGDAAAVGGLAAAARREGGDLPDPMLAAIFQQEAYGLALDGAEAACLAALDQACERAASGDPGDASGGPSSFCTAAYVEMQRSRCRLRLGRPAQAKAALDSSVRALPPVYRRDRGVALSALASACAALGEPAEAATTAMQALEVARDAGSERIVGIVQEAIPDSHGKGILDLDQAVGVTAAEAAASLYDGGVRRLLLEGGLDTAMPFLDSGLVDRVVAYLPHGNASRRPSADLPWPLLPPGFVITGAVRAASFVRVDGEPDAFTR